MPYIKLDAEGFEAIYNAYWRRLFDFALAKTQDRDVSEEIIQSLFVEIWEKRDELKIRNLRSYLFVSVRNRVIDHYNEKLFADLEFAANATAPDYPMFLDEMEASFNGVLGHLSGKTREIFILNRLDGKSAKEISLQLKVPERTVEYHITQALRQLRSIFRQGIRILLPLFSFIIF